MKKNYDSKTDFPELAATYSNEWTVIKNREGKTVFVSPSCFQITGYEVEDFIKNDHLMENITIDDSYEIKQQEKSNGERVQLNCFCITNRMGENLYISQHVFHETDEHGEVVYDVYVNQNISFWKEAENELCKSKEKYEKAFTKNPCLMGFSKLDTGEYLEVNQAFYDLLQLKPEEVIGRKPNDIFVMHEAKREKYVKKLLKDGFLKNEIIEIEDKKGEIHTLSSNAELLKQDEDLLLVAAYDISELYKIRKELLYFNRLYEILTGIAANYINMPLEKIETGIVESLKQVGELVMADRAYVFKYDLKNETATCTHEWCGDNVSPQIQNLQGIPLDTFHEYQTHRLGDVYFVEDTNQIQNESLKEELQQQGIQSMVSIPLMHNGELMGTLGFDSVKQQNIYTNHEILVFKLLAQILVNIRLRQHSQQEMDNSKERFRLLIDYAPVLINAFDSNARCVLWNKQCEETFGYTEREVMEHANPLELFYPDVATRRAVINTVTLHPVNEYLIWNPYTKSRKQLTTKWLNYKLPDGLIINIGNDISQRTREVAQIRKVEAEYQLLFENMNEGFALCHMIYDENRNPIDWVILKVNKALERNAGFTHGQLIGKRIKQIFPDLDPFWFTVFGKVAIEGKKTTFQKYFPELNRHFEISAFSPMPNQFATIITDITKRKAADESVRKQLLEIIQYQNKLKNLNTQLIDAEESERRRIAEFLHDDLGQLLSAAHLQLTSMVNSSTPLINQKKITETASELINTSINLCRNMTYNLNTPLLKKFGLLAALKWKLNEVQKIFGIKTTMKIHFESFSFSESLNNLLYRVLAEIINNAAKHSKCNNIVLEIKGNEKIVLFTVFDDGIGFDFDKVMANQNGIKYGLFNIGERLFPVSGKLMVETIPGKGSNVGVLMKISE